MNRYSVTTPGPIIASFLLCAGLFNAAIAREQQFHDLGECPLESGEIIEDCVIGYRTLGALDARGSNVVLIVTWGLGTSGEVLGNETMIGPDGWVDPERHFIVILDAFGNGVSSSPSNSRRQPGEHFPAFTILDMVHAQHRLVTEGLGLEQVHAVTGVSFGAMATYEWVIHYPDFVSHAVPVVGTPRRSPFDRMIGEVTLNALADCEPHCEQARESSWLSFVLMLRSPRYWNRRLEQDQVADFIEQMREAAKNQPDTHDMLSQSRAGLAFDVSASFDGVLERAAQVIEAEVLIVVANHDMIATPESSRVFADLSGARLYESDSDCGHLAFLAACDGEAIAAEIREFLW